jgi:23S rRNA (cytidine1920-2'-O)/16S rRNA (cytidine1409-2'-O)-methyltransferase
MRASCVWKASNARYLRPDDLPEGLRTFQVITIDVSFISLDADLPVVPALLGRAAAMVALIKPQFEAGRAEVGAGRHCARPGRAGPHVEDVSRAALQVGLARRGLEASPVTGAEGNQEFLALFELS